jgi:hypothetical protein
MARRSVLLAILLTTAILVTADRLTDRMARNSVPRQKIRAIADAPATIDVLGIGNSLIAAGFDASAVERTCSKPGRPCIAVNGGLGATDIIEHLALTRLALRGHAVKTLVYGFFDLGLSSDPPLKNSDFIGNRNMLYYLEPQLTLQYAHFDTADRLSFDVFRRSALLRERSSIWAKVETLRRAMGSVGMPRQETNRFGRRNDFSLLEADNPETFALACQTVIRSGNFLSPPFRALLQQAEEHGAKVVVVEMPIHPTHMARFYSQPIWETLRAKTKAAVESAGAVYINASTWIPGADLFEDPLHLSDEGARQFSRLLAERLLQQPD